MCRKKLSEIDKQFREEMHTKFNKAYFDEGAAMYLSYKASSSFVRAKKQLIDNTDVETLVKELSTFRTQLKQDLKIHTKQEAETQLKL